jgi:hypothetical protein
MESNRGAARLGMAANNDILLGVARAADPAKLRTAASRLQNLSGGFAGPGAATVLGADAAWTAEVTRAIADASRHDAASSAPAATSASSSPAEAPAGGMTTEAADAADNRKKVYAQFEALILQNMIEAMLPQDASSVYGSGTAGSVWKSMLAEKVATEISRTGKLGIAKAIAAGELSAAHAVMPNTPKATDA